MLWNEFPPEMNHYCNAFFLDLLLQMRHWAELMYKYGICDTGWYCNWHSEIWHMCMSYFSRKRRLTSQRLEIETLSIPREFIPNVNVLICFTKYEEVLQREQQIIRNRSVTCGVCQTTRCTGHISTPQHVTRPYWYLVGGMLRLDKISSKLQTDFL